MHDPRSIFHEPAFYHSTEITVGRHLLILALPFLFNELCSLRLVNELPGFF